MEQKKAQHRWTNTFSYEESDYLDAEQFQHMREDVRQCWRELGMLQLRMENDIKTNVKKKISVPEITRRLRRVAEKLNQMTDDMETGQK